MLKIIKKYISHDIQTYSFIYKYFTLKAYIKVKLECYIRYDVYLNDVFFKLYINTIYNFTIKIYITTNSF